MLILAIFSSLVVLGAHLRLPSEIAARPLEYGLLESGNEDTGASSRSVGLCRLWGLTAAPLLLTVGISWIFVQLRSPDFGIGGGFERPETGLSAMPVEVKLVAILVLALLITDLMVLFAGRSLDANAWRVVALLGLVGAVGCAYGFNATALRVDSANVVQSSVFDGYYVESGAQPYLPGGPLRSLLQAFLLATIGCASAGVLAAPMLTRAHSGSTAASALLRFVSVPAALAALLYLITIPALVRSALVQQQDHLTALAAAALFLIEPWLPRPLSWPSLAGATVLFALFLSRIIVLT